MAEWNSEITHALRDGALHVLQAAGVQDVVIHEVPGSFELPLGCQWLLAMGIVMPSSPSAA